MTARELRRRFPKASESFIAANARAADELDGRAPKAECRAPAPAVQALANPEGQDRAPVFRLVVILPLPSKKLSPNARYHWAVKANAVRNYRLDSKLAALKAFPSRNLPMLDAATVQVTWYHRTNARSDSDNLTNHLKAAWDGFTDSGLWRDDRNVTHRHPIQLTDKANPRVEIIITSP